MDRYGDVSVANHGDGVATVTIERPPDNYFDAALIASVADAYEALEGAGSGCRAIVLRSEGKNFCAGAALGGTGRTSAAGGSADKGGTGGSGGKGGTGPAGGAGGNGGTDSGPDLERSTRGAGGRHLYDEAIRLFAADLPVVAAIRGAAIGGGLGLALSADFRVGAAESRMSANFARLGFHHGFALSATLPPVVGQQRALELLLTGARLSGTEAHAIGLLDRLVGQEEIDAAAHAFAAEIAASAPLAVASIRRTMRQGVVRRVRAATEREKAEQDRLTRTRDFAEGVRAMAERRPPEFQGR